MIRRPPRSPLFPYPPLFRSPHPVAPEPPARPRPPDPPHLRVVGGEIEPVRGLRGHREVGGAGREPARLGGGPGGLDLPVRRGLRDLLGTGLGRDHPRESGPPPHGKTARTAARL